MEIFNTFGVDPIKFLLQLFIWFLILGVPAVIATKRVMAVKSDSQMPLWLLFVWLVPLFGPYVTLYVVKSNSSQKGQPRQSSLF